MPPKDPDRRTGLPGGPLFTFRITRLLDLLRRSGTLANRREFGVSGIEWQVMSHVGAHAPLSLNELADRTSLDRGQLSRAVKALVGRGLLDSRRKPGGPAIVITLSDAGDALHARMMALARERNAFLTDDIADEDIAQAAAVLAAVTRKAFRLLEREQAYALQARERDDRDSVRPA